MQRFTIQTNPGRNAPAIRSLPAFPCSFFRGAAVIYPVRSGWQALADHPVFSHGFMFLALFLLFPVSNNHSFHFPKTRIWWNVPNYHHSDQWKWGNQFTYPFNSDGPSLFSLSGFRSNSSRDRPFSFWSFDISAIFRGFCLTICFQQCGIFWFVAKDSFSKRLSGKVLVEGIPHSCSFFFGFECFLHH